METTKQKRINVLDTLNTIDISFNNKLDIDSLDILINNKRKIGKHSNCDKYGMIDFLNNIEFSDGYIFNDEDELFNFIYDIDVTDENITDWEGHNPDVYPELLFRSFTINVIN